MSQNWSDEETFKLIAIWGEDDIQAQINMCKRNSHIYDKITREMKDAGFDRTATQCCNKIKKLRREYRKKKDKKTQTGESNAPWTFFEALDCILGHRPATCPPTTIDSSRSSQPSDEELERTEDDNVEDESSEISIGEQTQGRDQSGTADSPASNASSSSTSHSKSPVIHPHTPSGPPPKKRKIAKSEQAIHAVQTVVDQLLTAQKESEDKFSRIEQRRLELDTQMLEMERERQRQDSLLLQQMMRVL